MFVLHLRSAGNTCRRATAVLQAWGWNHQSQQESPEIGGSSEWPDFWHDYAWWSRRNLCGSAGRPWRRVSSGPSRDSQIQVRFLDRISINVFETWRLVRRFDTPHGQLRRKHVRFCTACKVLGIGMLFHACQGLPICFYFCKCALEAVAFQFYLWPGALLRRPLRLTSRMSQATFLLSVASKVAWLENVFVWIFSAFQALSEHVWGIQFVGCSAVICHSCFQPFLLAVFSEGHSAEQPCESPLLASV